MKSVVGPFNNELDWDNHNVLPIDFELRSVYNSIMSGNNTIVNATQGTRKIALITNLMAECIANNKRLLYVSEKNYRSIRKTLTDVKLTNHVYDANGEFDPIDEVEDQEKFDKSEMIEVISKLHKYQGKFNKDHRGFSLGTVFKELIKLRDNQKKLIDIEFYDELAIKDVLIIKNTLLKLETTLRRLEITNLSESCWNDIDVKESIDDELNMIQMISILIEELVKLDGLIKKMSKEAGFDLPSSLTQRDESITNLDLMDYTKYHRVLDGILGKLRKCKDID